MGEIPTDASYMDGSNWGNPSTWTSVTILPHTNTIWMRTRMSCSSQWAELSVVWLMISNESWPSSLCTSSWASPKGLSQWLRWWEGEGWMFVNKPLYGQNMWKDTGVHLQEPESTLFVFHIPACKVLTPTLAIKNPFCPHQSMSPNNWPFSRYRRLGV